MTAAEYILLEELHRLTGGLGVTVATLPVNGDPCDFVVVVRWRAAYLDDGGLIEVSPEREATGDTMAVALQNAVRRQKEIDGRLALALRAAVGCPNCHGWTEADRKQCVFCRDG